jgi:hypothetical protein
MGRNLASARLRTAWPTDTWAGGALAPASPLGQALARAQGGDAATQLRPGSGGRRRVQRERRLCPDGTTTGSHRCPSRG